MPRRLKAQKDTHPHTRAVTNNTRSTFPMQVFDAGEKLFIALVERDGCSDDASEAGKGGGGGGGTEDRTAPSSRKVVVRDDYVQGGENSDIFLVDREFSSVYQCTLPSARGKTPATHR